MSPVAERGSIKPPKLIGVDVRGVRAPCKPDSMLPPHKGPGTFKENKACCTDTGISGEDATLDSDMCGISDGACAVDGVISGAGGVGGIDDAVSGVGVAEKSEGALTKCAGCTIGALCTTSDGCVAW